MARPVTVVGAGLYGTQFVGPVITPDSEDKKQNPRKVQGLDFKAYVETSPNWPVIANSPVGKNPGVYPVERTGQKPNAQAIPLYTSVDQWQQRFSDQMSEMLVDMAVPAEVAPEVFEDYVSRGARHFVLNKPVTMNPHKLNHMIDIAEEKKLKTAVASNWFYSPFTQKVAETIRQYAADYPVKKADINYSLVSHRDVIPYPPTEAILPHAAQILQSTGLADFKDSGLSFNLTKAAPYTVNLQLKSPNAPVQTQEGIEITADNVPKETERKLKVYLQDGDDAPDIIGDFTTVLDGDGDKYCTLTVDVGQGNTRVQKTETVKSNNMVELYSKVRDAFEKPWVDFQQDKNILKLWDYKPLGQFLIDVYKEWQKQAQGNTLPTQ